MQSDQRCTLRDADDRGARNLVVPRLLFRIELYGKEAQTGDAEREERRQGSDNRDGPIDRAVVEADDFEPADDSADRGGAQRPHHDAVGGEEKEEVVTHVKDMAQDADKNDVQPGSDETHPETRSR